MSRGTNLPLSVRVDLVVRVWFWFLVVQVGLRARPLPDLIVRLARPSRPLPYQIAPRRLGVIVQRVLGAVGRPPRCLVAAMVSFRLMRQLGQPAELVIGLPRVATAHDAHAWVEIDGEDVGPPPGRGGHQELARFR